MCNINRYRDPQLNSNVNGIEAGRRYDLSSVHSSASSELGREHSSSSSGSLRNKSNQSIDQSSSKPSLYDLSKSIRMPAEKRMEDTISSPNNNQSEEKAKSIAPTQNENWKENEHGPLYYHHSTENLLNTVKYNRY